MKTGARLPRGIRWLGLMALGGVSLAVQAEEKIVLLTSWYAQAEQGGYYQAQATGLYKKYGLDVEIRSGGPQVNGMQLLLSKRADVIIGYDLQLLEGIQRGFQAKAIAAPFQYDPQGLLTHADVTSLQGLKDKTLLVSSSGQATWWPWLKAQYQLSDAQVRPYTFNTVFRRPRRVGRWHRPVPPRPPRGPDAPSRYGYYPRWPAAGQAWSSARSPPRRR